MPRQKGIYDQQDLMVLELQVCSVDLIDLILPLRWRLDDVNA